VTESGHESDRVPPMTAPSRMLRWLHLLHRRWLVDRTIPANTGKECGGGSNKGMFPQIWINGHCPFPLCLD